MVDWPQSGCNEWVMRIGEGTVCALAPLPICPTHPITYVLAVSLCCCSVEDRDGKRQGLSICDKWGWKLTNGSPLTMTSLPQNSESWLCLLPQEAETKDNNREWCFPSVCGISSRRDSQSLLGNSAVGFWQLQSHETRSPRMFLIQFRVSCYPVEILGPFWGTGCSGPLKTVHNCWVPYMGLSCIYWDLWTI